MQEKENYLCLYIMQDVLTTLVADVDFMKIMRPKFNLNLFNFVTHVLFSWECFLKWTKTWIINWRWHTYYKNGITGEITRWYCHLAEANNKYSHDNDETK